MKFKRKDYATAQNWKRSNNRSQRSIRQGSCCLELRCNRRQHENRRWNMHRKLLRHRQKRDYR